MEEAIGAKPHSVVRAIGQTLGTDISIRAALDGSVGYAVGGGLCAVDVVDGAAPAQIDGIPKVRFALGDDRRELANGFHFLCFTNLGVENEVAFVGGYVEVRTTHGHVLDVTLVDRCNLCDRRYVSHC